MSNRPEPNVAPAEGTTQAAVQASETIVDGKTLRPSIQLTDLPELIFSEREPNSAEDMETGSSLAGDFDASGLLVPSFSHRSRGRRETAVAAGIGSAGRFTPFIYQDQNMPTTCDRRRSWPEQEIRAEANTWQSIVDALPDPLLVLDAAEVVRGCNRAAAAFFRRSDEQVVGLPCHDVFRDSFGSEGTALFATIKSARLPTLEFPLAGRWFRFTVQAIANGPQKDGWVWTIADITAQRALQEG